MKEPLGITTNTFPGVDSIGVYESADGVEAFETDEPYLLTDGRALALPIPVFNAGGPVFQDAMGNAYRALPIKGVTPPDPDPGGITWDNSTTWDNGTHWS